MPNPNIPKLKEYWDNFKTTEKFKEFRESVSKGRGGRHYIESKCLECGKSIFSYKVRKFCNNTCMHKNKYYIESQSNTKIEHPTKYWLGKKRPEMNLVNGWDRTGIPSINKGKKFPERSGSNHPNFKGGLVPKICEFCKNQYTPQRRCETQRFCSSECRIEWIKENDILKGKNNGMYKDGRRCEYNYSFDEISRKLRLNGKCYICGSIENLIVHHVNLNKKDDRPTNLAVMCEHHHGLIHSIIDKLYKKQFQ